MIRHISDHDRLHNKVYGALETGNEAHARLIIAEHRDTFKQECAMICADALDDYGVNLL